MSIFTTIRQQRQQRVDDDYTSYIKLLATLNKDDAKQTQQLGDLLDKLGLSPDDAERDYQLCKRLQFLIETTSSKKQKAAKADVIKGRQTMEQTTVDGQAAILQWQAAMADTKRDYQTARANSAAINDALGELMRFDNKIKSALM